MKETSRKQVLKLLKKSNPRQRSSTFFTVEGKASEDQTSGIKEEISCVEPDLTVRQITVIASRQCDCGKLLNQKNVLTGACQHPGCKRYVCSGCGQTCVRCQKTFCPRHCHTYKDGETYCKKCRYIKLLNMFIR